MKKSFWLRWCCHCSIQFLLQNAPHTTASNENAFDYSWHECFPTKAVEGMLGTLLGCFGGWVTTGQNTSRQNDDIILWNNLLFPYVARFIKVVSLRCFFSKTWWWLNMKPEYMNTILSFMGMRIVFSSLIWNKKFVSNLL